MNDDDNDDDGNGHVNQATYCPGSSHDHVGMGIHASDGLPMTTLHAFSLFDVCI